MALKLSLGLARKVGQPDYGSLQASCHVEFELDGSLLKSDLERFHQHVKNAYVACSQAVHDELGRQQSAGSNGKKPQDAGNGKTPSNGSANGDGGKPRSTRSATSSQIRAIHAISARQQVDLAQVLYDRFGAGRPEELSISEASELIDELKSAASGTGGQR